MRACALLLAVALLAGEARGQTSRRSRPAGSGVPAAALPVARAQPHGAPSAEARQLAAFGAATPVTLPDEAPVAGDLDPRVFRVDPRDEIIVVSPLQAPTMDYGDRALTAAPTPDPRRSPAVPPPAVTRIEINTPDTPAEPTRVTVRPNVAVQEAPPPAPEPEAEAPRRLPPAAMSTRPDPRLDERSARRSRAKAVRDGTVASLAPTDLIEYSRQPARVKHVIKNALALCDMGLGYKFGSADPSRGGLDCSGTISATLSNAGMRGHPRDSFSQYEWLAESGSFHLARGGGFGRFNIEKVRPGDLLFWTNTYRTKRNPPVTHVALYLGREKATGRHVMVHAGGGKKYNGKSRRGVTVANFDYPDKIGVRAGKGSFFGYGSIPGVR
jgi:cell wall-associated NlpC family hydrolase